MIINKFYSDLFDIACRDASPTESDIANKEKIISAAIDKLPENERNLIRMLKPLYTEPDPNGVNSMIYLREVCRISHKKPMQIKAAKEAIQRDIINIIISLLPHTDDNS